MVKAKWSVWKRAFTGLVVVLATGLGLATATPVAAAGAGAAEVTISPANPQAEPSGAATTYTLAVTCSSTNGDVPCGGSPAATVTIPLEGTSGPTVMSTWGYSATTSPSDLLTSGPAVVADGGGGYDLQMVLSNTVFIPGVSGTISLQVTPPDNTTPNNTTWSLLPTLAGGNIATAQASAPASGTATAKPVPVITKFTQDGGSVYLSGTTVTYDISASCSSGGAGNLYMTDGSLVDPLPAGMTYVSSSPAGGVYDPTSGPSGTVTWTFPSAGTTPTGCAGGSTGANSYDIVATAPTTAPGAGYQPIDNTATFAGEGPDVTAGSISAATDASADIDVVDAAPTAPGSGELGGAGYPTISKSSLAPLADTALSGNQYEGTYAGNWVATSSTPSYTVGAAAGSYRVSVDFPLTHTYETQLVDPLPCLDHPSGNTYSSDDLASTCSDPAFDTTVVEISGPGTQEAADSGLGSWNPSATLTDGSSTNLSFVSSGTNYAYYSVPAAAAGEVADIVVPTSGDIDGDSLTLTLWGYADTHLVALDVLHNTAWATPYLDGDALQPISASADLYIFASLPQLGVSKSFGGLGQGPGGTTLMTIEGAVSFPATPAQAVVLTDLLPSGLSWTDAPPNPTLVTLTEGSGASSSQQQATASYTPDYEGTGRNLIRLSVPADEFSTTTGGYWTITTPVDFFELSTPTALGTYPNTDQIFLYDIAPAEIDPACTTPTQVNGGVTPASFESYNPMNLAGDGQTQEDYCQNGATLVVEPTGAAFSLTKTVQGDLDASHNPVIPPKGALGIGDASGDGSGWGIYGLTWSNAGSDTLQHPVIYDILPYVGDTGVSAAQATVDRGSQFAPTFDSMGSVPAGITVYYSDSSNPCRPQVYASAPGCASDWSTNPIGGAADVKALEFIDGTGATYLAGSSFSVSFKVDVPTGDDDLVAWNSAATNADDYSNPSTVPLAAEPPKVGLTPLSGGGPALSTTASTPASGSLEAFATTPLTDSVTIVGTGGTSGTLNWSFVGPVLPGSGSCTASSCTCAGLDWSAATTVASGSITTPAADGVVTVGLGADQPEVQGQGCYSWTESLSFGGPVVVSLAAGAEPSELVQALAYNPSLTTTATPALSGTTNYSTDSIVVSNSGIGIGNGAPSSTTLSWALYGPATPVTAGTCTGIDWSGYPTVLDSGTIHVDGDGGYATSQTDLYQTGCYTYVDSLPQTLSGLATSTSPGDPPETFILLPPPTVSSQAQQLQPHARAQVTDDVTLGATYGHQGTVAWKLVGPVAVPGSGDCSDLQPSDWAGATTTSGTATTTSGTVGFSGNEMVAAPASATYIGPPGCYSWVETASGPNFVGSTTLGAGASNEYFKVLAWQPAMTTTAEPAFNAGTQKNTVYDRVAISNDDLDSTDHSHGAPSSATLTWTLYGPVPPQSGSCSGLDWSGASIVATGTTQVSNGANNTPAQDLATVGCYTYTDSLDATSDTLVIPLTSPGLSTETFQIIDTETMTTTAGQPLPNPRTSVSDSVDVNGAGTYSGTLAWSLVGPVNPVPGGGCSAADFSGAAVFASGSQGFTGNQTNLKVPTAGVMVGASGCYSWAESLTGANFLGITTLAAGDSPEIFEVPLLQPLLSSAIAPSVSGGAESVYDNVTVTGTDIAPGNSIGAPVLGTIDWTLYGPVTPIPADGCTSLTSVSDWPVAGSGTISVTGNNATVPYTTGTTGDLTLDSCYSYAETLEPTSDSAGVSIQVGFNTETTAVPPPPSVATSASVTTSVYPRATVWDSVTIQGITGGPGNNAGDVNWELVGPVNPVPSGGCSAVNWTGAPVFASGSQSFSGNQAALIVPSADVVVGGFGCYSWAETVAGSTFPGSTSVPAGSSNETFLVTPLQPSVVTTITPSVNEGTESAYDSITVTGTDIGQGDGAPASATLTWTLYGPEPVPADGCTAVSDWSSVAASGSITVTGNTTAAPYTTPPTNLALNSCYSYADTLPATADNTGVVITAGSAGETVEVPPAALVSTSASPGQSVNPRTAVWDSVTIQGTGGGSGTISWQLLGPVNPVPANGCTHASWSGAPVFASGTQPVTGDQSGLTVPSAKVTVGSPGCYGWSETVSGISFPGTTVVVVAPSNPNEAFLVNTLQPALATTVAPSVSGGNESTQDDIVLSGTDIAPGNSTGAPTSGTITWELYGPVTPSAGGCAGVDWNGAAEADSGVIPVNGDGTYHTTSTGPLTLNSCYSYAESLAATTDSAATTVTAGAVAETADVPPPPVVTTATPSNAYPYSSVSDSVTVSGLGAYSGNLGWELVGPLAPVGGSCADLEWSGAPSTPLGQGMATVSADGTVTTGPVALGGTGCYSWADTFSGTFPGSTSIAAGAAGEVVLVEPHSPSLTTKVVVTPGGDGTQSIVDNVTVTNSGGGSSLNWALLGPVAPVAGSCAGLDWTKAATLQSASMPVDGNGTYATPAVALTAAGCYTYTQALAGTSVSLAASSAPGSTGETALLLAAPSLATTSSSTNAHPHSSVYDTVTVSGTAGSPGLLDWALLGPVPAAADGTCNGAVWAGAAAVASGTVAVSSDGNLQTGPAVLGGVGCYGWQDTFTGAAFVGETSAPAGSANEVVLVGPFRPVLTTKASLADGRASDTLVLSGSGLGSGPGAPTSGVVAWTLLGPARGSDCASVAWVGQPVRASGSITVHGDGTYFTPATSLSKPGCYTFEEALAPTADATGTSSHAGSPGETVSRKVPPAPPTTTTTAARTTTTAVPTTTTTSPATTTTAAPTTSTTRPTTTTTRQTDNAGRGTTTTVRRTTVPSRTVPPESPPPTRATTTTSPPNPRSAAGSGRGRNASHGRGKKGARPPTVPNGLAKIGTDLGLWPPSQDGQSDNGWAALAGVLALLAVAGTRFVIGRRRRRRPA
jgi:hypothetical protein